MKHTAILICFLLCSLCSFAQRDTIFFNKDWKPATRDSAAYFRLKPKAEKGLYPVTDYYLSGKMQMTGTFSNLDSEVKEGYFIFYDSLGHKENEGVYHNNKRNGFWKFYHKNSDQLKSTGFIRDDTAEGTYHYYHAITGKLVNKVNYENGKMNGVSIGYFADGKTLHFKSLLRNDTTLRQRIYDSATGYLINTYDYNPATDTSYRAVCFRATNKISRIYRFNHTDVGYVYYYDSLCGKLRSTGLLINGQRDSVWTFYYRGTNLIQSTETYVRDTLDGWVVNYDTLNSRSYKKNEGKHLKTGRDSTWQTYYPNGTVKNSSSYDKGKLNGSYASYDSLGNVLSKGSFAFGKKIGEWHFWDPKTLTLLARKHYISGSLVGAQDYYYPNGKIKTAERYNVYGQRTEAKSYTEDGKETSYQPSASNASFPGEFQTYKETYLEYPPSELIMDEGKVRIIFTVAEDGSISNAKLTEGIGLLWDENALRFVNEMPRWNPAYYNGLPTESVCTMTFLYKKKPAHIKVSYETNP